MVRKRILIVDDEQELVNTVADYLNETGFQPLRAYNGQSALALFEENEPALVILDLGLPDIDGLDVARRIRARSQVPLIMLTARAQEIDRLVGLELGADDYIVKPFSPRELMLRVQAILRRVDGASAAEEPIRTRDLTIDPTGREAWRGKNKLDLTPTEFDLLLFLARWPNRVFTRMQLLEKVQGYTTPALMRNIDNHIMNLRRKIEKDPTRPQIIKTVYGVGYKLAGNEK
jgi:DNA-binding response OmpR family regulator